MFGVAVAKMGFSPRELASTGASSATAIMTARTIRPVMPRLSLRNSRQNRAIAVLRLARASARGVSAGPCGHSRGGYLSRHACLTRGSNTVSSRSPIRLATITAAENSRKVPSSVG